MASRVPKDSLEFPLNFSPSSTWELCPQAVGKEDPGLLAIPTVSHPAPQGIIMCQDLRAHLHQLSPALLGHASLQKWTPV